MREEGTRGNVIRRCVMRGCVMRGCVVRVCDERVSVMRVVREGDYLGGEGEQDLLAEPRERVVNLHQLHALQRMNERTNGRVVWYVWVRGGYI